MSHLTYAPASTPVFDAFAWLAFLAGRTERIRLGTNVYLLGLRHPFVAARAVQTLDLVSEGRAEIGIGAGWLREGWVAAGAPPPPPPKRGKKRSKKGRKRVAGARSSRAARR